MLITLQAVIQKKLVDYFSESGRFSYHSVGGGSINESYHINFGKQLLFCKVNSAIKFPGLFIKEKNGLALIRRQGIIKVPSVIDCFEHEGKQMLLLEWIREGERTEGFWREFGEQLAGLHHQSAEYFGLSEDNYMGSVIQQNTQHSTWASFFIEERLQPMIEKCQGKNLLSKTHLNLFLNLFATVGHFFEAENPSLVHGDLWSGNFMCDQNSKPMLIDPAVYYGHRSMDLAMTTLFGGFQQPFYDAYHHHFPLPSNYREQWEICNLYPLLIHLYLFGESYLPPIESTLRKFAG